MISSEEVRTVLENTLELKQEMVRDYQEFAGDVADREIAELFRHFAEGEALHAVALKEALKNID